MAHTTDARCSSSVSKMYFEQPYLKTLLTEVARATSDNDKRICIIPKQTIFHPKGGGQPQDRGVVRMGNQTFGIGTFFTFKNELWTPLLGTEEMDPFEFQGQEIELLIDWEYRYTAMRLHTSAHLLMSLVRVFVANYQPKGIEISDDLSACVIKFSADPITGEVLEAVISAANNKIRDGADIHTVFVNSIDEARHQMPDLFRADSDIKLRPPIRMVLIDENDFNPCGGTHLADLSEIGLVRLQSFSTDGFIKEISFTIENQAASKLAIAPCA